MVTNRAAKNSVSTAVSLLFKSLVLQGRKNGVFCSSSRSTPSMAAKSLACARLEFVIRFFISTFIPLSTLFDWLCVVPAIVVLHGEP